MKRLYAILLYTCLAGCKKEEEFIPDNTLTMKMNDQLISYDVDSAIVRYITSGSSRVTIYGRTADGTTRVTLQVPASGSQNIEQPGSYVTIPTSSVPSNAPPFLYMAYARQTTNLTLPCGMEFQGVGYYYQYTHFCNLPSFKTDISEVNTSKQTMRGTFSGVLCTTCEDVTPITEGVFRINYTVKR